MLLQVEGDVKYMKEMGASPEEIEAYVERRWEPYEGPSYTLEQARAQGAARPPRRAPLEAMKDWEPEEAE